MGAANSALAEAQHLAFEIGGHVRTSGARTGEKPHLEIPVAVWDVLFSSQRLATVLAAALQGDVGALLRLQEAVGQLPTLHADVVKMQGQLKTWLQQSRKALLADAKQAVQRRRDAEVRPGARYRKNTNS
jgi:hypothetical protein